MVTRVERSEEVQGEAGGTAAPGTLPSASQSACLGGAGRVLLLLLGPRPGFETETTGGPSLRLPPLSSPLSSTPSPKLPVLPGPMWPWASQSLDKTESGFL